MLRNLYHDSAADAVVKRSAADALAHKSSDFGSANEEIAYLDLSFGFLFVLCADVDIEFIKGEVCSLCVRVGNEDTCNAVLGDHLGECRSRVMYSANACNSYPAVVLNVGNEKSDLVHMCAKHYLFSVFSVSVFHGDKISERVGIGLVGKGGYKLFYFCSYSFLSARNRGCLAKCLKCIKHYFILPVIIIL